MVTLTFKVVMSDPDHPDQLVCSGAESIAETTSSRELSSFLDSDDGERFVSIQGFGVGDAGIFWECPSGEPGHTNWLSGTWQVQIHITSTNSNLTWSHVAVCRVDSSGNSQETIANESVGHSLSSAGILEHTFAGISTTAQVTDRIYIVLRFTNTDAGEQSFGYVPDQPVSSPLVEPVNTTGSPDHASMSNYTVSVPPEDVHGDALVNVGVVSLLIGPQAATSHISITASPAAAAMLCGTRPVVVTTDSIFSVGVVGIKLGTQSVSVVGGATVGVGSIGVKLGLQPVSIVGVAVVSVGAAALKMGLSPVASITASSIFSVGAVGSLIGPQTPLVVGGAAVGVGVVKAKISPVAPTVQFGATASLTPAGVMYRTASVTVKLVNFVTVGVAGVKTGTGTPIVKTDAIFAVGAIAAIVCPIQPTPKIGISVVVSPVKTKISPHTVTVTTGTTASPGVIRHSILTVTPTVLFGSKVAVNSISVLVGPQASSVLLALPIIRAVPTPVIDFDRHARKKYVVGVDIKTTLDTLDGRKGTIVGVDMMKAVDALSRKTDGIYPKLRESFDDIGRTNQGIGSNMSRILDSLEGRAGSILGVDLGKAIVDLTAGNHIDFKFDKELLNLAGIGFQWMGLRKVNYDKKCVCDGAGCKRCMNIGFSFTDILVKGYMWTTTPGTEFYTQAGRLATEVRNVVLRHDARVDKYDYILALDLDKDTGEPRMPLRIRRVFIIQNVSQALGKNGKREFWSCKAEERVLTDGRRANSKPDL